MLQSYPTVVESPCKQLKLEERTIEPVINMSNISSSSTPLHFSSSPSSSLDTGISMLPRLSLASLSPPLATSSTGLITPPVMMTTPVTCTFLTPPTTSYSNSSFPPLTPPSFQPSSFSPSLLASSLLAPQSLLSPPGLGYSAQSQRALLDHLVSSMAAQRDSALFSRPALDTALTLLNRQQMLESQTLKCLGCHAEFTPNVQLNIFPFLCSVCTLRKLIPLQPDIE